MKQAPEVQPHASQPDAAPARDTQEKATASAADGTEHVEHFCPHHGVRLHCVVCIRRGRKQPGRNGRTARAREANASRYNTIDEFLVHAGPRYMTDLDEVLSQVDALGDHKLVSRIVLLRAKLLEKGLRPRPTNWQRRGLRGTRQRLRAKTVPGSGG